MASAAFYIILFWLSRADIFWQEVEYFQSMKNFYVMDTSLEGLALMVLKLSLIGGFLLFSLLLLKLLLLKLYLLSRLLILIEGKIIRQRVQQTIDFPRKQYK
jgi:hypothetical protein